MALLNAEPFSLYGTSIPQLLLRGYSSPGTSGWTLSPTLGRTNGFISASTSSNNGQGITYILPAPVNKVGSGVAMELQAPPLITARQNNGLAFGTGADGFFYKIAANANLGISFWAGNTLLGESAPALLAAGTYYWLEACMTNNTFGGGLNTGTLEVRLNGTVILAVSGINITAQFQRISLGANQSNTAGAPGAVVRFCDWIMWDGSGTSGNHFFGDRRCNVSFPNADSALQQWSATPAGPGFSILDNSPAIDTQFVQANNVGDISEFQTQPISINSNDVAGIVLIARAAKADAGPTDFRLGINSAGVVQNSPLISPNVAPSFSYFTYVIERNPNGNIPWTRTTADAALARITRNS